MSLSFLMVIKTPSTATTSAKSEFSRPYSHLSTSPVSMCWIMLTCFNSCAEFHHPDGALVFAFEPATPTNPILLSELKISINFVPQSLE